MQLTCDLDVSLHFVYSKNSIILQFVSVCAHILYK